MKFLLKNPSPDEPVLVSGNVKTRIAAMKMDSYQIEQCFVMEKGSSLDLEELNSQLQANTNFVMPLFFNGSLSQVSRLIERRPQSPVN